MKTFKELTEVKNSSAVFTFGRFNPPTTGHEKLISAVARQHSKNAGSEMFVYASHSNDPKKNPLPHAKKIAYMRAMFPKYKRNILSDKDRNVFEIATSLYNKGYRSVVMVVGSDRVNEFTSLLNKYNDVKGRHGYYNFNNIEVVSAGERDPDAEGVEGMSASKMRAAAVEGDYDTFKLGLPGGFKHGLKLFRDIRSNMGIREERDMGEMTDHEELRDAYLVGKIWNIGDLVEANGVEGNVVNRGTNYLSFCDRDGKVHKAWLHDIAVKGQNYKEEYETNRSDMEHFNEYWLDDIVQKVHQMTHPKNYGMAIKDYVDGMRDKKNKEHSAKWAADVAKRYSGIEARGLIRYINSLISKGKLPKELKAQYTVEVKQDPDIKDREGTQPAKYYAKDTEGDEMSKSTKQARARHFAKYGKKDDEKDKNYKPAPGDAGATTKPSKHTLKFRQMYGESFKEQKMDCPPSTQDLKLNTKNRDATIKNYNYGPLNVDEPGDYWKDIAKYWKTTETAAKKSVCNNCVAFDVSPRMLECLPGETSDDDGRLGYCWMHHFKCHSARACHTWAKGGPITTDEKSHDWQERAFSKKEGLEERTLTDKEKDDKEHNVMKLKKHMDTFKDRYGKDAKSVMYAIATRDAKKEKRYKEEVQLDEKIKGLINKSDKSGISYSILKKVYDRGMAAWKTGHRPGTTPQQWAFARVNSFITKGKGTWGGADKDLARQVEMVESVSNINEWGEVEEEAEYQGRKVKLNNPMPGDVKKTKVYVRNDKGNVVKVEFGDPNMEIKRDDPERRKSFRARHNCDNPGPKWKARYWSCKFWEKGKSVTDLMKG